MKILKIAEILHGLPVLVVMSNTHVFVYVHYLSLYRGIMIMKRNLNQASLLVNHFLVTVGHTPDILPLFGTRAHENGG